MRALFAVFKLVAVIAVLVASAFLHHGHIQFFLTDVRRLLTGKASSRLQGSTINQESSRLQLYFADPATYYEVAVRRITRSLEVGLYLDGSAEQNARLRQLLADRSGDIRAKLGRRVELEDWTKNRTRLGQTRILSGDDWSPKRDLTPALVDETADLVLRFIRVLEPILQHERSPRGAKPVRRLPT
jgi:hypothetical protein